MFDRRHPFMARLKEISPLTRPGSTKETYHLVLDLGAAFLPHKVGDSIGVLPSHDPILVEKTLSALKASGEEEILDQRTSTRRSLREHLTSHANITHLHKQLLEKAASLQSDCNLKSYLEKVDLGQFELWDFLEEYQVSLSPQEIVDLLPPLLPRFYSIASSPALYPHEIHLTVTMTDYETRGITRHGVGTHYLCRLQPQEIPIYIQSSNGFTIPEDLDSSIIMVGPGTGVAPFRAFMQSRLQMNARGKHWLFFGERHRATDFYYEDYWRSLESKGILRLSVAFSRDQDQKIYVQDRMREEADHLKQWLGEGAFLYVCGDAHQMAKDVDAILQEILSKDYVKELRRSKRYLRDVY